ncbi:hypothetical protein [Aeromonas dhakensis]|uniref:hypothetical protein n=1 Tax=Aeromonas dhakensis TaxID=196024 RepID=UPI0039861EB2
MTIREKVCGFFSAWWNVHHEKSNNFFTGLSGLVTILAIIIGGGWTAYTFDLLHQAEKAQQELIEIQERIKNTASSSINLDVRQTENPELGVVVEVNLTNNGRSQLHYSLKDNPLKVYSVIVQGDKVGAGKIYMPKPYKSLAKMKSGEKNKTRESITVLTGAKKTISYVLTVDKPGLYYITFEADHDDSVKIDENVKWFASKYFEVTEGKDKKS